MSLDSNRSFWDTSDKQASPSAQSTGRLPTAVQPSSAAAAAPAQVSSAPQERRRHPRFKCEGNLELKTDGSTIRTWATFTDISTTGCYVEMMTTFPVGTRMELQLGMNGFLVNGSATVRVTYPFLGMGIEFTNLSQNAREQLDAMIASLAAGRLLSSPPAEKKFNLPPITEPMAVLHALEHFFEAKPSLSAEEFLHLVTTCQKRT